MAHVKYDKVMQSKAMIVIVALAASSRLLSISPLACPTAVSFVDVTVGAMEKSNILDRHRCRYVTVPVNLFCG